MLGFLKKKTKTAAAQIGHVPVDSGCLMLIDPAFLRDVLFKGNEEVEAWYEDAVVGGIDSARKETWPIFRSPGAGSSPLGHLVVTGYGDGFYPVQAVYAEDGTLAEVTVRFSRPSA